MVTENRETVGNEEELRVTTWNKIGWRDEYVCSI